MLVQVMFSREELAKRHFYSSPLFAPFPDPADYNSFRDYEQALIDWKVRWKFIARTDTGTSTGTGPDTCRVDADKLMTVN